MKSSFKTILILLGLSVGNPLTAQNIFLQENAAIYVQEEADLQIGGDLQNEGLIENLGKISISGDFLNNSIFNGSQGELAFMGDAMQQVFSPELELDRLTVDGNGNEVVLEAEMIIITDELEFIDGILRINDDAELIIADGAQATGGSETSYFDGELIQLGTGFKYYPIGNNGLFAPIELEDVTGIEVRMKVSVLVPNSPAPVIADNIIGVSEHAIWNIQVDDGTVDSALVTIEFDQADLENFTNKNDINADRISPVIVRKDSETGTFETLGVSELTDTDSLTFGRLTAEQYIKPSTEQGKFIAVGLAPLLPDEGLIYIPNAFSPSAIDDDNKRFKVFGVKVSENDFELKIFDRSNVLVYETSSYEEANNFGWDGTNQNNGNDSPSGLYYYTLRYRLQGGTVQNVQNAIYLIR